MLIRIPLAAAAALLSLSISAHEFIVKPEITQAKAGQTVPVTIYSTETYIKPHRLPPESTRMQLIAGDKTSDVSISADAEAKVVRGQAKAPSQNTFILSGHSLRERTGGKRGEKSEGPAKTLRMETFSKAFVNLKKGDPGFQKNLGLRLEVMPLQNPAELVEGEKLTVKILLDGKPLATKVQATYDGYSEKAHGYVLRTESDKSGIAEIPLTARGLWLVRSKYVSEEGGEGFDAYEASSNIVFEF